MPPKNGGNNKQPIKRGSAYASLSDSQQKKGQTQSNKRYSLSESNMPQPGSIPNSQLGTMIKQQLDKIEKLEAQSSPKTMHFEAQEKDIAYNRLMDLALEHQESNLFTLIRDFSIRYDGVITWVKNKVLSDSAQKTERTLESFYKNLLRVLFEYYFDENRGKKTAKLLDFRFLINDLSSAKTNKLVAKCWADAVLFVFTHQGDIISEHVTLDEYLLNAACELYQKGDYSEVIAYLLLSDVKNFDPLIKQGSELDYKPKKLNFTGKSAVTTAEKLLNWLINLQSNKKPAEKVNSLHEFLWKVAFVSIIPQGENRSFEVSGSIASKIQKQIEQLQKGLEAQDLIEIGLQMLGYSTDYCEAYNLQDVRDGIWKKIQNFQKPKDFVFSISPSKLQEVKPERVARLWLEKLTSIYGDEGKWFEIIFRSTASESSLLVFVKNLIQKFPKLMDTVRAKFDLILQTLRNGDLKKEQIDWFAANSNQRSITESVAKLAGVIDHNHVAEAICKMIADFKQTQEKDEEEYNGFFSNRLLSELVRPYLGTNKLAPEQPIIRLRKFKKMRDDLAVLLPIHQKGPFINELYKYLVEPLPFVSLESFEFVRQKLEKLLRDLNEMSRNHFSELFATYSKWLFKFDQIQLEENLKALFPKQDIKGLVQKLLLASSLNGFLNTGIDLSKGLQDFQLHIKVYGIPEISAEQLTRISNLQAVTGLQPTDLSAIPPDVSEFFMFIGAKQLGLPLKMLLEVSDLIFKPELQNLDGETVSRLSSDLDLQTSQKIGRSLYDLARLVKLVQQSVKEKPASAFKLLESLLYTDPQANHGFRDRITLLESVLKNKSELLEQAKNLASASKRDENFLVKFFSSFRWMVFYYDPQSQGYTPVCTKEYSENTIQEIADTIAEKSRSISVQSLKFESELDNMSFRCERALHFRGVAGGSQGSAKDDSEEDEITRYTRGFLKIKQLYSACLSSLKLLRDQGAIYDISKLQGLVDATILPTSPKPTDIRNSGKHLVIDMQLSELSKKPQAHFGPLSVFKSLLTRAELRHAELAEALRNKPASKPASWVLQFTGNQLETLAAYCSDPNPHITEQVQSILDHAARSKVDLKQFFSGFKKTPNLQKSPLSLEVLQEAPIISEQKSSMESIKVAENMKSKVRLVGYEATTSKYWTLLNFAAKQTLDFPPFHLEQFLFLSQQTNRAQITSFLKHALSSVGKYYIFDPQLLSLDIRGKFITDLCQMLQPKEADKYPNAPNLTVICPRRDPTRIFDELEKQTGVIVPFLPNDVMLSESDANYAGKMKMIDERLNEGKLTIVDSKFAGLGKTHWIQSRSVRTAPFFISGEVTAHTTEKRLDVVKQALESLQEVGLHIKIDMMDKMVDNAQIVDHMLFQIVFLRSLPYRGGYFSFAQVDGTFIELGNNFRSLILQTFDICKLMNCRPEIKKKAFHTIEKVDFSNLRFSCQMEWKYLAVVEVCERIDSGEHITSNTFTVDQWDIIQAAIDSGIKYEPLDHPDLFTVAQASQRKELIMDLFLDFVRRGERPYKEQDATMSQLVALIEIVYHQFRMMETNYQLQPIEDEGMQAEHMFVEIDGQIVNLGGGGNQNSNQAQLTQEVRQNLAEQIRIKSRDFIWSNTPLLRQESNQAKDLKKNLTGFELQRHIASFSEILHNLAKWDKSDNYHLLLSQGSLKIFYRNLREVPNEVKDIAELTKATLIDHDQFRDSPDKSQEHFARQLMEALDIQFKENLCKEVLKKDVKAIVADAEKKFEHDNPKPEPNSSQFSIWAKKRSSFVEKFKLRLYLDAIAEFDGGKGYSLNKDNYLKMVLIYQRAIGNLPVVLVGSTGCGKTYLTKFLVKFLLREDFACIVLHTGVTEADIETFILGAIKKAEDNHAQKEDNKVRRVWVFFDEFNTCPYQSLIEEIVVSRTCTFSPKIREALAQYDGRVPDNMVFITACNPLRGKSKEMDVGLVHESASSFFSHRVHPIPEGMLNLAWDFGQLPLDIEKDHMRPIFRTEAISWSEQHNLIESIAICHDFLREKGDSTVCLRDAERVKTVYLFLKDFLAPKPSESDLMINSLACTIYLCYFLRIADHKLRHELEQKLTRAASERFQFEPSTYGIETSSSLELKIGERFRSVSAKIVNDMNKAANFPPTVSINSPLKETIFAIVTSIFTKIPLMICGRPGTSKTLSSSLVRTFLGNLTHEVRTKSEYFKRVPQAHFHVFNGSELTTSVDILRFHKKCVETARNLDEQALKQRREDEANPNKDGRLKVYEAVSVFLFDELGLAEIGPDNPLKVLHTLLEPEKHLISFIGISNWKLDQSKMSRALFVARPDPQQKDLKEMFNLPEIDRLVPHSLIEEICHAYTNFQKNEALEKHYQEEILKKQAEGTLSDENPKMLEKNKFLHPDFFGLRDLYNLIKFLNRHVTKLYTVAQQRFPIIESPKHKKWVELLFRFVINGIERNFSGKKSRLRGQSEENLHRSENVLKHFFAKQTGKGLEAESFLRFQLSTVTELMNQNLLDDECRYLMLFTENPSINASIIDYLTSYFKNRGYEKNKVSYYSRVRSREEMDKIVQNLPAQIEQGHVLILYQTPELNSCLFEVLNNQRIKTGPGVVPARCELQTGGDRNELVTIHPNFRVIMLMDRLNEENMSQKQPAPFLNRFEKQLVVYEDLISQTRKIQQEEIQRQLEDFRNNDFGQRQLLLHGYSEEILHSLVLREQHENLLLQGSLDIETYINQVVFEEKKAEVEQKEESLADKKALVERGLLDMTRLFSRDMLFYLEIFDSDDGYLPIEQIEQKFIETHPFESLDDIVLKFEGSHQNPFLEEQMTEIKEDDPSQQQIKNLLVFTTTQSYETLLLCHKHGAVVVKRVQEYDKLSPDESTAEIEQLLQRMTSLQIVVFLFESRREWQRMPELRRIVDNVKQSQAVQVIFIAHYTYQELAAPNLQVQTSITFSSRQWEQYVVEDLMGSNYRWLIENFRKPFGQVLDGLLQSFSDGQDVDFGKHTDLHLNIADIIIRKINEALPVSYETVCNMFAKEPGFFRKLTQVALETDFPDKQAVFLDLLKKDALLDDGSLQTLDFEVSMSNWTIKNAISSRAGELLTPFVQDLLKAVSVTNLSKCLRVGGTMATEAFKSWLSRSENYLKKLQKKKIVKVPKQKAPGSNPFESDEESDQADEPEGMDPIADEVRVQATKDLEFRNSLIQALQILKDRIKSSLQIKQLLSEISQLKRKKTVKLGMLKESSPEYGAALEEDKEKLVKLFKELLQQLGGSGLTDCLADYKDLSNIDKFAVSETIPAIYMQLVQGDNDPSVSLLLMRLAFEYFQQIDNSHGAKDHLYGTAMVLLYEIFQADLQLVSSDIFQDRTQLIQILEMFTRGFLLPMGANLKTLLDAPVSLNQTQGSIQASLNKVEEIVSLLEKSLQEQAQEQLKNKFRTLSDETDVAVETATDQLQQNLVWSKLLLKLYKHLVEKDGAAIKDFMGVVGSQSGGGPAQMTKENFVLQSAQGLVDDQKLLTVKGQQLFVKDLLRDMLGLLLLATVEPEHHEKILSVQAKFAKRTVDPKRPETLDPLIDLLSSLILKQVGIETEGQAVQKIIDEMFDSNSIGKTSEEAQELKQKIYSKVITKIEQNLAKTKQNKPELQKFQNFSQACEFFNDLLVNARPNDPIDVSKISQVSMLIYQLKTTVLKANQSQGAATEDLANETDDMQQAPKLDEIEELREQEYEEERMEEPEEKEDSAEPEDDEDDWEDCSDDEYLKPEVDSTTQTDVTAQPGDKTHTGIETNDKTAESSNPADRRHTAAEWQAAEIDRVLAAGVRGNRVGAVVLAREIVRYLGSSPQALEDHGLTLLAACYREATEHKLVQLLGDRSLPQVKKIDGKIQSREKFTDSELQNSDWSSMVRFASQIIYTDSDQVSLEALYPKDDREESNWVTKILDSKNLKNAKDNYAVLVALAAFAGVHRKDKKALFQTMFSKVKNLSVEDEKSELHNGLLIKDIMETIEKFTKDAPQDYRVDTNYEDDDDEDMRQEKEKKLKLIERQEAELASIAKKFSLGSPIRYAIFKLALPRILDFIKERLETGQIPNDFFRSLDDHINRLMNNKRLEEFLKTATEDGTIPDDSEKTRLQSLWTAMGMMDPLHSQSVAPAIRTYLPFSLPSLDDLRENLVAAQAQPETAKLLRSVLNVLEYREIYEAHPQVLWSLKELVRMIKRKFDFKFTKEEAETIKLSSFVGERLEGNDGDDDVFVLSSQGAHFDQQVQRAYLQFRKHWRNYLKLISQHQKFSIFKFQTKSMNEITFKEADLEQLLSTDLSIAHFLLRPEQDTKDDPTKRLMAAVLTNLANVQNNLIESFGIEQAAKNPLFKMKREHLGGKLGETGNVVELCSVPEPDKQQVMNCLFGGAQKAFRNVDYKTVRPTTNSDFEKYNYRDGEPVDIRNTALDVLSDVCKLDDGPENVEAYRTAVTVAMKMNTTNAEDLTAMSRFLLNSLEDFQKVDGITLETELEAVFKQPPIKVDGYKQLKMKHLVHFVTYLGRMKYTKVIQPALKKKAASGLKVPQELNFDHKEWASKDMAKRLDMEITYWYYLLSLTPPDKLSSTEKLFGSNFMHNWSWYRGAPRLQNHSESHPILVSVTKVLKQNHSGSDSKLLDPEKATLKGSVLAYLEGMNLIWKNLVAEKDPTK